MLICICSEGKPSAKQPKNKTEKMKTKITAEQDYQRHVRLSNAFNHIVHNDDPKAEAAYYKRHAKHEDFCLGGDDLPNQDKEYFAKSPYSSIEVCGSGYVLTNHVTGKSYPFATYKAAVMARGGVSSRYQAISRGDTPAHNMSGV